MLGEYVTPLLVGGTKGVMVGNLVANFFDTGEYSRGAAAALLIAAFVVAILMVFRRSLDVAVTTMHEATSRLAPGRLVRGLGAYGAAVYLFVFAPIVLLVLFSFNANPAGAFPITGLTTRWYREMFSDYELQDAFWTSLDVALQVTAISLVVGMAAAFPLARARMRFRNASGIAITLPIMLPGLLIGISLLVLLGGVLDLSLSRRTAVIGQSIFTTPFVICCGRAAPDARPELEWAASDLARTRCGGSSMSSARADAGAGRERLLAFTLSFDEFIITLFLIGGDQTLPLYIFTHVRYGITPAVNAVASMFLSARSPFDARARLRLDRAAAEALLEPARGEGDELDGREQVRLGGADAAAHPDARRQGGARHLRHAARSVRKRLAVHVDVVQPAPARAVDGRERQRVGPPALARDGRDRLGVVQQRQGPQRRAEHQHLAAGLDQPGEGSAGAEAVVSGCAEVSQPASRPTATTRWSGWCALPRARPGSQSLGSRPYRRFASDSSGSNPGISSR